MKKSFLLGVTGITLVALTATTLYAQIATGTSIIDRMKAATRAFTLSADLNPGQTGFESAPIAGKKTGNILTAAEWNRVLELISEGARSFTGIVETNEDFCIVRDSGERICLSDMPIAQVGGASCTPVYSSMPKTVANMAPSNSAPAFNMADAVKYRSGWASISLENGPASVCRSASGCKLVQKVYNKNSKSLSEPFRMRIYDHIQLPTGATSENWNNTWRKESTLINGNATSHAIFPAVHEGHIAVVDDRPSIANYVEGVKQAVNFVDVSKMFISVRDTTISYGQIIEVCSSEVLDDNLSPDGGGA